MAPAPSDEEICKPGHDGGIVLPLFGQNEQNWPTGLRVVLYLLGLLWCFMGVGVICDTFMGAIEAVTSKKKRVPVKGTDRFRTVKVWNDTVSNLTLMALGSSAPEILLSIIELLGRGLHAGDLGPSTIVGSAAFNLLCIISVCISAIPHDEVRAIKDTGVFALTAVFSIFAYFWLIVVLIFTTPEVVTIPEAVLTFIFIFFLIGLAYLVDIGFFKCGSSASTEEVPAGTEEESKIAAAEMSKEELAKMVNKVRRASGTDMSEAEVMLALEKETAEPTSRAVYKAQALRGMFGGKRIHEHAHGPDHHQAQTTVTPVNGTRDDRKEILKENASIVEFAAPRYSVLENCQEVRLSVVRRGNCSEPVSVTFETRDGTAKNGSDYHHVQGKLHFDAGETEHVVRVPIIDDSVVEEEEHFYCELSGVEFVSGNHTDPPSSTSNVMLGIQTAMITIIDDDYPGVLAFESDTYEINESVYDSTCQINILRKDGTAGKVSCKYQTENHTAFAPLDFEALEGELVFENGQTSAQLEVKIKGTGRYGHDEMFRLVLFDPEGGAKFDEHMDGGKDQAILSLFIKPDEYAKNAVDSVFKLLQKNWTKANIGHSNWKDQFTEAFFVNGGDDDEDAEPPVCMDYVMHAICLPWKIIFAFCPPTDYAGGWVCFCCALGFIGLVTAIVGDMAKLAGCCMGIPDSITAITIVALGTSLPDTFASKTAAEQDPYADASIVNVTGSNSVNVFLGLGIPFIMGSIYWNAEGATEEWKLRYPDMVKDNPDGGFIVRSGDLGFSVIVFTSCAILCLLLLAARRMAFGAELGGPKVAKIGSSIFLFLLWVTYIALCSWNSMKNKNS